MNNIVSRSDHCPAMKGIETLDNEGILNTTPEGSDHCPAMKGIETSIMLCFVLPCAGEATTAPQ